MEGVGSKDNNKFELVNKTLKTKAMFNYEIQPYYSISMRVLDSNGLMKEKVFVIRIQDA